MKAAKVESFERLLDVNRADFAAHQCVTSARTCSGYDFDVPLLAGDHVTDEDGTGFVHTAPGHGREDFDIWMENAAEAAGSAASTPTIPFTVDGDGRFTKDAPGFEGKRVIDDKGNKGDANEAVIEALVEANALIARGRLKHQYPHSWRSKKPVIFRNTPQWFIAMDKPLGCPLPVSRGEGRGGGAATRRSAAAPHPSPLPARGRGTAAQATARCARSRCGHRRDRVRAGARARTGCAA